jgi:hypothetical protein
MKRYFSLGLRNGFATLENMNIAHLVWEDLRTVDENKEQEGKLKDFFNRMRLKISKSNTEFSTELARLKVVILLILLLLCGLYVGCFVASHFAYSHFLSRLEALTVANSLRHQSLTITALVGLLDLSGQGVGLGWQPEQLLQSLNQTTIALKSDLEDFRTRFDGQILGSKTLKVLEFGTNTQTLSPADALLTQATFSSALFASSSLPSFSISTSPRAF